MKRGFLFWREEWYSICSAHIEHNPECENCKIGRWVNVIGHFFDSLIYKIEPDFWRWYTNKYTKPIEKIGQLKWKSTSEIRKKLIA
jgi:hypothetical protein